MVTHRIIDRSIIYQGWNKFYNLRLERRAADGASNEYDWEVLERGDPARVLPYDLERRTVIMVRQLRVPMLFRGGNPYSLEAPAGMLDAGETPETCALRECEEETGYRLETLEFLTSIFTSPGAMTELVHLFVAPYGPHMKVGAGGGHPDENEDIEVLEMPFDEVMAQIPEGNIDATTIVLLQHLALGAFAQTG